MAFLSGRAGRLHLFHCIHKYIPSLPTLSPLFHLAFFHPYTGRFKPRFRLLLQVCAADRDRAVGPAARQPVPVHVGERHCVVRAHAAGGHTVGVRGRGAHTHRQQGADWRGDLEGRVEDGRVWAEGSFSGFWLQERQQNLAYTTFGGESFLVTFRAA